MLHTSSWLLNGVLPGNVNCQTQWNSGETSQHSVSCRWGEGVLFIEAHINNKKKQTKQACLTHTNMCAYNSFTIWVIDWRWWHEMIKTKILLALDFCFIWRHRRPSRQTKPQCACILFIKKIVDINKPTCSKQKKLNHHKAQHSFPLSYFVLFVLKPLTN